MMEKSRLKEIVFDQKEVFSNKKNLLPRDLILDPYLATRQVVVITGIRRCGKSSLLFLLKEAMQLDVSDFCYFNFDDERVQPDIALLEDLYKLHMEVYGKEPIFFFDEIQNVEGWEKGINRFYEQGIKIFVTGSNARLLSSEIATSLTGRNKRIELHPFSFSEYLRYYKREYPYDRMTPKWTSLLRKDLHDYMQTGGFPLVLKENDIELINGYFQDILYRDIVTRFRLTQVQEIRQMGVYLASNISKLFSYKTLQDVSGLRSLSSVKDYLHYFEQSYLFHYVRKFDYSLKKQILNPRKVYTSDPAFANRLGFSFSENKGRVLENIVYLELSRRYEEIYYYSGKNECDFLVKTGTNVTEAIQVVYQLDKDNYQRELQGLLEAMQTFNIPKGLLLTVDTELSDEDLPEGIELSPCWLWLTKH